MLVPLCLGCAQGVRNQGMKCKQCGINSHRKCVSNIPNLCGIDQATLATELANLGMTAQELLGVSLPPDPSIAWLEHARAGALLRLVVFVRFPSPARPPTRPPLPLTGACDTLPTDIAITILIIYIYPEVFQSMPPCRDDRGGGSSVHSLT